MVQKSKADRLKETIRLLNELKRVGITEASSGYSEIKDIMSQWVTDGIKKTATVELFRHGRKAEISLPDRADRAANIALKVVVQQEELKEDT